MAGKGRKPVSDRKRTLRLTVQAGIFILVSFGITAALTQLLLRKLLRDYLELQEEVELITLSVDELRSRFQTPR